MNRLLILLALLLISNQITAQDSIYLQDFRNNSIPLTKNEISLPFEVDNISGINVIDNDVMLIRYKRPKNGYHFSVYSIKDQAIISNIIPFGGGEGQMVTPGITIADDYVMLTSFQNSNYTIIPFSTLHSKEPEIEFISNFIVPPTIVYEDSLIYSDMFYFEDRVSGLSNNRPKRFMKVDRYHSNMKFEDLFSDVKYNTSSLYYGYFATNDKNLFFANNSYPRIDMYDSNLSPVKYIVIEDIEIRHYASPEYGNHIFTAPNTFSGCNGICYTDSGFFVLYHGIFIYNETSTAETSYILSFDWNGEFLKSYSCQGQIKDLRVFPDENVMYATETKDDKIRLLKLTIDEP